VPFDHAPLIGLEQWSQRTNIAALAEHVELTTPYLTLRVTVSDALDEGTPVWRFRRADRETRETWKNLGGELIDG
jgi:hypothetical protein